MGKVTPKRCPNCGSTTIHNQELESPHDYEEWYDMYCRDCEWSGDISPDLPLNPKQNKNSSSRKRQKSTGKGKTTVEELWKLSEEAKKHPEKLIPIEDVK